MSNFKKKQKIDYGRDWREKIEGVNTVIILYSQN